MKSRRGISSVIGAVFFIIIFTTTISYVTYDMNLLNNFSNAIVAKNQADSDASHEQFSVTKVTVDNNKFNITVQNSGNIPINITRLWVQNKTDVTWGIAKYDILKNNGTVYPGHTLYNIGQKISPTTITFKSTQGYDLKLVTSRGNTKEFFVNSASQSPLYLQLFALPASGGPNSFNTTLLFAVTNNMTNGGALSNVSPIMIPTNITGQAIKISGPTPSAYPLLQYGDTAYFQWIYKITGTNGQKVNFNATLNNHYLKNFVSQNITLTNVTSGSNIGHGGKGLYAGVSANNYLQFKNIVNGSGIIIKSNATDVMINSTLGGTVSTGSNIGHGGKGVFAGVAGNILKFKNVTAGNAGISVNSNATDVIISNTGAGQTGATGATGATGGSSTGTNIGHGSGSKGFYAAVFGNVLQFKNATAGNGITVSSNSTDVTISFSGASVVSETLTVGTSFTQTNVKPGDVLLIFAKGDITGVNTAQTISLNVAGSVQDQVDRKQAAAADKDSFTLIYQYSIPSNANVPITVTTTGGTLNNVKIQVIQLR